jgi:hypothetical protein
VNVLTMGPPFLVGDLKSPVHGGLLPDLGAQLNPQPDPRNTP